CLTSFFGQGRLPLLFRPGLPPARATAGKSDRQQGQRPHKAAPPAHDVPPEGSGACRLHRDSGDGNAVRGLG
ncbi:hypothetical protein GW17_00056717, partial [Ensete ventricosum]